MYYAKTMGVYSATAVDVVRSEVVCGRIESSKAREIELDGKSQRVRVLHMLSAFRPNLFWIPYLSDRMRYANNILQNSGKLRAPIALPLNHTHRNQSVQTPLVIPCEDKGPQEVSQCLPSLHDGSNSIPREISKLTWLDACSK